MGGDIAWICDDIITCCDTYTIRVGILCSIVDKNVTVGDCHILGDVLYFGWVHDKKLFCTF